MASGKALNFISKMAIPAAIGVSLFQASVYDVKGGNRAVIFDRLKGVKETVCRSVFLLLTIAAGSSVLIHVATPPGHR